MRYNKLLAILGFLYLTVFFFNNQYFRTKKQIKELMVHSQSVSLKTVSPIKPQINATKATKVTTHQFTTTLQYNDKMEHFYMNPHLNKCEVEYKDRKTNINSTTFDYVKPVSSEYYHLRIVRAVLFYFPIKSVNHFIKEFRWVYRSWIEMQKHEIETWRTDLVVFLDNRLNSSKYEHFSDLNCSFKNIRMTVFDMPMCTLVPFISIDERNYSDYKINDPHEHYNHLFRKVNIFNQSDDSFSLFYRTLRTIKHYQYVDSILMAFDGYKHLKGKYHFVIRSDMDVFLTPLFGKWIPRLCNDFVVGGGAYSNEFNIKRLRRIARTLNFEYKGIWNLGSTWYSTPQQFRIVSYLTLVTMAYISNEEFTSVERKGGFGVQNWPEWHYGVLLLYGQNVAMNHLLAKNEMNFVKLDNLFDYPSGNNKSVFETVHIHVYHGADLFSKFMFTMDKYDNMNVSMEDTNKIRYYCLYIALESKRRSPKQLTSLALDVMSKKK